MIHRVKAFTVNEADVDFLWGNFLAFSMIQQFLTIWSPVPLPFLNPDWTSEASQFILLKPSLKGFEHYLASMWNEYNCTLVWTFFRTALLGTGMKTDLLQSCGHCWVFQICWHIECSTLKSFRIWNNSAGLLSPPLALFVVMLLFFLLQCFLWQVTRQTPSLPEF